jgi:hypothetical protein
LAVVNRAFAKDRGLCGDFGFVVVMFQRKQQWEIGIAVEGILEFSVGVRGEA